MSLLNLLQNHVKRLCNTFCQLGLVKIIQTTAKTTWPFLLTLALLFVQNTNAQPPVASFNYSKSGLTVNFNDQSTNAYNHSWDFGDGNTSNVVNPTHTYNNNGNYSVCLSVTDSLGTQSDTACATITVSASGCSADFSSTTSGLTANFNNNSSGASSYTWNFGDGTSDTSSNPSHTYSTGGSYNVCLIARDNSGTFCDSICKTVTVSSPGCTADFSSTTSGLTANFNNNSSGASSYTWNFGDGTSDTSSNPSHTYSTGGSYNVCLIARDNSGTFCDSICKTVTVSTSGCSADFNSITSGLTVNFTNISTGASSYKWDFGDGSTDTSANATHTYGSGGNYTVCLKAFNTSGNLCDSICKTVTISSSGCTADFSSTTSGLTANFTNNSSGASSYTWNFGDGASDTSTNPSHTYSSGGSYSVCLIARNSAGNLCDSICKTVSVSNPSCTADFSYTTSGRTANFTNNSSGASSYTWNFGDGASDTSTNPSHTYSSGGSYSVCLIARNNAGNFCDSTCKTVSLNVNSIKGTVSFNGNNLDTGEVFLYEVSSGSYSKVDSLFIKNSSQGKYQFNNVDTGQYLVKAYPDSSSTVAASAVPTYHDSSVIWSNATTINKNAGQSSTANIYLNAKSNQQGPGTISGTIVQAGAGKRIGPGDPQSGVEVLALTGGGEVQDYDVSSADGTYEFKDLPLDTHQVHVEITGFTTKDQFVQLDENKKSVDSLNFEVNKDQDSISLSIPEVRKQNDNFKVYRIYPNPANTEVNIFVRAEKDQNLELQVTNSKGQQVLKDQWQVRSGVNKKAMKVEGLSKGIYLLRLAKKDGQSASLRKLIISR